MGIFKSDLNPGQILWVRYSVGSSLSEYLASLLDEEEIEKLTGLDCLIMNALRIMPHNTHQNLEQAIESAKRIGAKQTYFVHMSHQMGLHSVIDAALPEGINLAYDGLVINI